jgi:hypothetical protein
MNMATPLNPIDRRPRNDVMKDAMQAAGLQQQMRVRVTNEDAAAAVFRMLNDGWRIVPQAARSTVYDFINSKGEISPHRLHLKTNGVWHFEMQVTL